MSLSNSVLQGHDTASVGSHIPVFRSSSVLIFKGQNIQEEFLVIQHFCMRVLCCLTMFESIYQLTQNHVPEEWKPQGVAHCFV